MTEIILREMVIVYLIVSFGLNIWAMKKIRDFDKREKI